jgi:hypothetical protein
MDIRNKDQPKEDQDLIHLFTSQIQRLTNLTDSDYLKTPQGKKRADEIKATALQVLQKIEEQKEDILKKLGRGLSLPAAKGIVDQMSQLTDELRRKLEDCLKELDHFSEVNWREQATLWAQLYAKWHDQKAIEEDIIHYIAIRVSQMISKDLQVIDEYQNNSLEGIETIGTELYTLKDRLQSAIEAPMKAMYKLREPPSDISIEKVGEWISAIQDERERLFDSVLQRIEKVTATAKPFTSPKVVSDPVSEAEMNHEMISLQKEFKDILVRITHHTDLDKNERHGLISHLTCLIEHAQGLCLDVITPPEHKVALQDFVQKAQATLDSLSE